MFGGLGFDEFAIVLILGGLFLKKEDLSKALKAWKKFRHTLSNWQFDVEEKIDFYTQDISQSQPKKLPILDNDPLKKFHKKSSQVDGVESKIPESKTLDPHESNFHENLCAQESEQICGMIIADSTFVEAHSILVYENEPIQEIPDLKLIISKAEAQLKTVTFLNESTWIDQDIDLIILPSHQANPYGEREYKFQEKYIPDIKNLKKKPAIISCVYSKNYTLGEIEMSFQSLILDKIVHPSKGVLTIRNSIDS